MLVAQTLEASSITSPSFNHTAGEGRCRPRSRRRRPVLATHAANVEPQAEVEHIVELIRPEPWSCWVEVSADLPLAHEVRRRAPEL